jgi:acyl-homoserine-lactone acylase
MARKKAAGKPTRKKSTPPKKKPQPRKNAALSTSARLKQGNPTSEAELSALFATTKPDDENERDSAPVKSAPSAELIRPRRRYGLWAALVFIIAIAGGYIWLRTRLSGSLVPEEGVLTVHGLTADVEIRRDSLGVPYIKAQNLNDMAFGAGFAMAADRDFQMEFLKRMAYGRLSEVLGKETVGVDMYMRSLSFASLTRQNFERLPAKLQDMLKAYAAGVNAKRRAYPQTQAEYLILSIDAEEWQPSDSLALYQLFSFLLATNHIEELTFLKFAAKLGVEKAAWLFPVYPGEPVPIEEALPLKDLDWKKISAYEPFLNAALHDAASRWQALVPSLPASNNWVVAPNRTKNGKSLLANDTHLQMSVPAMWYMMNLECPEYRAAGVALPGTPVVALGTNGTIAWGATMVMADNQDIFLEQVREQGGKWQYLYKGEWLNAVTSEEEIKVRWSEPRKFKKIRTRHGVLLNEALQNAFPDKHLALGLRSDYGLAYKTSVGANETTFEGIFALASAKTMREARAALDKVTGIYLNVVYADEKNIGWLATGRYPARKGASGLFPRIGWTGENEWQGYYVPAENPAIVNPKDGYLATANHRIWDDSTELWVSASWFGPDRADRAQELLAAVKELTAEDMAKFQSDVTSPTARKTRELLFSGEFSAELKAAIDLLPPAEKSRAEEALALLKDFDGNLNKDSAAAAVYENFVSAMAHLTFADELGGHASPLWENFQGINKRSYNAIQDHLLARADSPFWDNTETPEKQETKAMIFAAALARSISECEKQMGKERDQWAWGKIHHYYWQHQFTKKAGFLSFYFNRGPIAAGGDLHTLNQAGNLWGDSHHVWLIPAMRMIVDFSADEPAQLIVHMGVSGNAESPHYADMIPLFAEVRNHPLPLKAENVEKQYARKFVLKSR